MDRKIFINHLVSAKAPLVGLILTSLLAACGETATTGSSTPAPSTTTQITENPVNAEVKPTAPAVENSGSECTLPALPDYNDLTATNDKFPDPFTMIDGTAVTHKEQWRCRRAEIAVQAQKYELGEKPGPAQKITGEFIDNIFRVTVEEAGKSISYDLEVTLPEQGTPPFPAMIGIGAVSLNQAELMKLGVALIKFPNNDIAEQINSQSRGKGKFYELYGADHTAGALMAWAWGVSRAIDALEISETPIDASRLGITGCSRNGKGAIIAGAFDERIALTIGQESGSGGAASWRISDAQLAAGQNVQTLRQIVTENVWFTESFKDFSESVNRLPFDHHQVLGMIAPRGLLIIENSIEWLGIESAYVTPVIAQEIWTALGVADHLGVSQMLEHPHCQQPAAQQPEINAFVKKFLLGDNTADTQVIKTETGLVVDKKRWVDWSTPSLQ